LQIALRKLSGFRVAAPEAAAVKRRFCSGVPDERFLLVGVVVGCSGGLPARACFLSGGVSSG